MQNTNLSWSILPGCYEYHLRCRYQNPLFPSARREVSQVELEEAQQKDTKERAQFKEQVNALLPEMQVALSKKQTVSDLLKFHRQIYDLIEQSGEIGGNLTEERKILTRLFVALDEDAKNSVAHDKEATESLKKLREHLYGGAELQVNNFLAQMTRKDSPITAEDVVPRFLSEDMETIERALPYFRQNGLLETLRKGVTELVNASNHSETNTHDPNFRDKVKLIFSGKTL